MKPKYHLLRDVPDVLRVTKDGELYCSDGQDVTEYLKNRLGKLPKGEPLAIVPSASLKKLNDVAWLVPHLCLAC